MNFYGEQDLTLKQAENMSVHKGTNFPIGPVLGQLYYKTGTKKTYIYTSTGWVALGSTLSNTNVKQGVCVTYSDSSNIAITSGTIEINNIVVSRSSSVLLRITNPSNFIHGALVPNAFYYVYVYLSGSDYAAVFSDEAPNYSNVLGNIDGTLRYRQYGGTWYRFVGSVLYTSAIEKFNRYHNFIAYDLHQNLYTFVGVLPRAVININCAVAIPETSRVGLFRFFGYFPAYGYYVWPKDYPEDPPASHLGRFINAGLGDKWAAVTCTIITNSSRYITLDNSGTLRTYCNATNNSVDALGYYEDY